MRKYLSLKSSKSFREIKKSKPYFTPMFSMRCVQNTFGNVRVGIITNKKVGNAVIRNKCKRRIKNALDSIFNVILLNNKDIVIVARKELLDHTFQSLHSYLKGALQRQVKKIVKPI